MKEYGKPTVETSKYKDISDESDEEDFNEYVDYDDEPIEK
jgi:hypothetical protein